MKLGLRIVGDIKWLLHLYSDDVNNTKQVREFVFYK